MVTASKAGACFQLVAVADCSAHTMQLFLSSYTALAWLGPSIAWRVIGPHPTATVIGMAAAGLSTTLEKRGRQQELAMYCLSRGLEVLAERSLKFGLVKVWPHHGRCCVSCCCVVCNSA